MIKELKIDKTGWTPTKFGKVAIQQKGKVDRENTHLTKYVKGEHMGSNDVHLRNWGELEDEYLGPAFITYFEKGDILYGSRRTYLKKVNIAPFEGITSNTTFVIKANEKIIDKRLLPFLMLSNNFTEHSVHNSKGSVNPYINWKDLANYEFLLPPIDQQKQLAKLLWAMDEVIEKEKEVLLHIRENIDSRLNQFMIYGFSNSVSEIRKEKCRFVSKRLKVEKLGNCIKYKPIYDANASSTKYKEDKPRYIRITDIDDNGNLIPNDKVGIELNDFESYLLSDGDFLFARTGNTVGKTLLYDSKKMERSVFAGYLIKFVLNEKILLPKFLFYYTKSRKYEIFKRRMAKVGAQPNINSLEYSSMIIPLPEVNEQNLIIKNLDSFEKIKWSVENKIHSSENLLRSLIHQIF